MKVANIANVIPFPILIQILICHFAPREGFDSLKGFEDRDAIVAPAADIVDLTATGILPKPMNESGDVEGVNVVSDLFAFIAVYSVRAPLQVAFDEVTEKSVELDAAVVGPGQTAATQHAAFKSEVASILLHHYIASHFGSAKKAVLALVDGEALGDAVRKVRIVVFPAR